MVVQGTATRRRMPSLPAAKPPHRGFFPRAGPSLRFFRLRRRSRARRRNGVRYNGAGARALDRPTGCLACRWTFRRDSKQGDGRARTSPSVGAGRPAYCCVRRQRCSRHRSPSAFANDLAALVIAARGCVGNAAVVIAGVAPLAFFPGLPWPLRTILGWRCAALQASAERLSGLLARLVVERFSEMFVPELFASDGFHPNGRVHALWGEEIAALALPLLADGAKPGVPLAAARGSGSSYVRFRPYKAEANSRNMARAAEENARIERTTKR